MRSRARNDGISSELLTGAVDGVGLALVVGALESQIDGWRAWESVTANDVDGRIVSLDQRLDPGRVLGADGCQVQLGRRQRASHNAPPSVGFEAGKSARRYWLSFISFVVPARVVPPEDSVGLQAVKIARAGPATAKPFIGGGPLQRLLAAEAASQVELPVAAAAAER
jgi:hypothetical protein